MQNIKNYKFEEIPRKNLKELTDKVAAIYAKALPRDQEFLDTYYEMIPKVPALLAAVERDAGGMVGYICDLRKVLNAISTSPQLKNAIESTGVEYNSIEKDTNHASVSATAGEPALAVETTIKMITALSTAAKNAKEVDLAETLDGFAKKVKAASEKDPDTIFNTEEASWWGADMELLWSEDESHLIGIKPSGYYTLYDTIFD